MISLETLSKLLYLLEDELICAVLNDCFDVGRLNGRNRLSSV